MKLLLYENLSRRLAPFLQHDYPGLIAEVAQTSADIDAWLPQN